MPSDVWTTVASTLHARHYAAIAKALRAREYNARSVRGQWRRCVRVAVPDTDLWAWWSTATDKWGGVLYLGPGQIIQVGELTTDVSSATTDVEKIAERIAIMVDEVAIEASCCEWWV